MQPTNTPNNNNGYRKEESTKTEKVFVVTKLNAGKYSQTELVIPKGLGDETFVVTVTGKEGTLFSVTGHRPIGFTGLSTKSWVISPTEEVPGLLARSEHPGSARIQSLIAKQREKVLVSHGFMKKEPVGTLWVYGDTTGNAEVLQKEAESRLKEDKTIHLANHEAGQVGKPKPAKYRGYPGKIQDFYPQWVKDWRTACNETIKADGSVAELRKDLEAGYVTMGGPLGDRPQVVLLDAGTRQQAIDEFTRRLLAPDYGNGSFAGKGAIPTTHHAGKGVILTAHPPKAGNTAPSEDDESDSGEAGF